MSNLAQILKLIKRINKVWNVRLAVILVPPVAVRFPCDVVKAWRDAVIWREGGPAERTAEVYECIHEGFKCTHAVYTDVKTTPHFQFRAHINPIL